MHIKTLYTSLVKIPSDINEHLPVLTEYASKCDHITEMGVRFVVSTFALVLGNPKKLVSIDLFHPTHYGETTRLGIIENYAKENNIDFQFVLGDTLKIDIEPTDMLFIDTWHTYGQLKAELSIHAKNVKKYLIFHDTTTFAHKNEGSYYDVPNLDTTKVGLWPAIEEFLEENKDWELLERKTNNNGLTVLHKKSSM